MAAAKVNDCNGVEFETKEAAGGGGGGGGEVVGDLKGVAEECGGGGDGKDDSTDGSYEFVDDGASDEAVVEVDPVGKSGGSCKENRFGKEVADGGEIQAEAGSKGGAEVDGELREDKAENGGVEDLDGGGKVEETRGSDGVGGESEKDLGLREGDCARGGDGDQVDDGAVDVEQIDATDVVVQLLPAETEGKVEASDVSFGECVEKSDGNNVEEKPEGEVGIEAKETSESHVGTCNGGSEGNNLGEGSVVVEERTDGDVIQVYENAEAKEDPAATTAVTEVVGSDEMPALENDNLSSISNGHSQDSENPSDLKLDREVKAQEGSERGLEDATEEQCETISTCTNGRSESQVEAKDVSSENSESISCTLGNGEKTSNDHDYVVCCPSSEAAVENNTESASVDSSTLAQDGSSDGKNCEAEIGSIENGKTIPACDADEVDLGDTAENISSEDEVPVSCSVEEAELKFLATQAMIVKWDSPCDVEINSGDGKGPEASSPDNSEELKTEDDQIRVEHSKDSPAEQSELTNKEDNSTVSSAVPGQVVGLSSDLKRLPCYMIRVPKFFDDKLMAQKEDLELQVDEKTRSRDSIKSMLQNKKGTRDEYSRKLDAARKEEKTIRDRFNAKRHEIDVIQNTINKMKNATSIYEIDDKINNLEHRIQHETIPLREEKQILREIKILKQSREKMSSSLGPQTEVLEAFDQKDQIEGKFERLKQEHNSLRAELLQVEMHTKGIKKKYDDECQSMRNLFAQRDAANDLRQETYSQLWSVKKEYLEKNVHFYRYKDDRRAADNFATSGDKETLRRHCTDQVEKIMELWNNNDEFRKQYVKFNVTSTVRRFKTLDARSLGPDEVPTVLPNVRGDKLKNTSLPPSKTEMPVLSETMHEKTSEPVTPEKTVQQPSNKVTQKSRSDKPQKSLKFIPEAAMAVADSGESVSKEAENEKRVEEDELTRKANEIARQEEELRKEKAAVELKEKIRLEQIAKAKEAEERKRRKAEKAKAKAELKAQREAELKEKKKAKKESRKEKKLAGATNTENTNAEADSLPDFSTSQHETFQEPEAKVTSASKRPSKALAAGKQINKVKPLPLPLRNRGKRKMQTWMWMLLTAVIVLLLFLAGNYISFSEFNLPHFGF